MITVRLSGGLGNQLFQYACARAIAVRTGGKLAIDLSLLTGTAPGDTPRHYALEPFCLADDVSITSSIASPISMVGAIDRLLLGSGLQRPGRIYFREQSFTYDPLIEQIGSSVLLEGCWQSERYFNACSDIIRSDLRLKNSDGSAYKDALEFLSNNQTVALHVRRGDYISSPSANAYHGVCSSEYYCAALENLELRTGNRQILVFSDDPEWCRLNLDTGRPFQLAKEFGALSDAEELLLFSSCNHQIIANSSFSWWGAWLNPDPDKVIIAPSRWFCNQAIDTRDLLPAAWVQLP